MSIAARGFRQSELSMIDVRAMLASRIACLVAQACSGSAVEADPKLITQGLITEQDGFGVVRFVR